MKRVALLLALLFVVSGVAFGQAKKTAANGLRIYFVDVEGGAATLIVTPAGESMLWDCGWPDHDGRDARRIKAAADEAGITRIDYLVITHFHTDHWGGVEELAKVIPIGNFYDRGLPAAPGGDVEAPLYAAYKQVSNGRTTALKAGDAIALKRAAGTPAIALDVVTANGQPIQGKPGEPNALCETTKELAPDNSDNARSVGAVLTFGKFRFLDLGDTTWNVEQKLACPVNQIGRITLYQVTHHGMNISNNTALLQAISPQVAVMDNGPRKGGSREAIEWVRAIPDIQDFYQLHRNLALAEDYQQPAAYIANLGPEADCQGFGVKVVVAPDGNSFAVTNARTGKTTSYKVRQ